MYVYTFRTTWRLEVNNVYASEEKSEKVPRLRYVFFLVGVAPPSFGYITAGVEVHKLTTTGDVMTYQSITIVIISALLSLAPVLFRRQLRKKLE